MLDRLLNYIAPHPCSGCGINGSILCSQCKNDIIYDGFEQCVVCTNPTMSDCLCLPCRNDGVFNGAWCVGRRDGALKQLLNTYKFSSAVGAAEPLVELLDATLPPQLENLIVVPVPTAPSHRRVRGFDHVRRIARSLARRRGLIYKEPLTCISTKTQHFKTRSERMESAAEGLIARQPVTGDVLLVDDIYTTGATAAACATLLRQNGAERVYLAIIARQILEPK